MLLTAKFESAAKEWVATSEKTTMEKAMKQFIVVDFLFALGCCNYPIFGFMRQVWPELKLFTFFFGFEACSFVLVANTNFTSTAYMIMASMRSVENKNPYETAKWFGSVCKVIRFDMLRCSR